MVLVKVFAVGIVTGALGLRMNKHCCEAMERQIFRACETHPDPSDCPDALVVFIAATGEYGLRIHDGGSSYAVIGYCPCCGAGLTSHESAASSN